MLLLLGEDEYAFMAVVPEEANGSRSSATHVVCTCSTDANFIANHGEEKYIERYGRHGIDKIWDDSIFPCPVYLRHCVLSAQKLNEEAGESFLDHTYLADRKTTIREYLDEHPEILSMMPPPSLAQRYGGH